MKYIGFLRGINVGGVKIKMTDLKSEFEREGMTTVQTILNTGNVIFDSSTTPPDLSFLPVFTFIKTAPELKKIVQNNPFNKKENFHIYVFIAQADFAKLALEEFSKLKTKEEAGSVVENVFYWQVPIGSTLHTPFGKILGKKQYKEKFTSRNLNTIERIASKL